jgi:hypothetical protein
MNRKTVPYGTFRDYPKIDIYERATGRYIYSTTWSRTCKEAVSRFTYDNAHLYTARFA